MQQHEPQAYKVSMTIIDARNINPLIQNRAQQLLRIAYAHAQAMLYRPFLHFVATDKRSCNVEQRAYTCAASYVNLSRNHIHLAQGVAGSGVISGKTMCLYQVYGFC